MKAMKRTWSLVLALLLTLGLFAVLPQSAEAAAANNKAAYKAYTTWIRKGADYQGTKYTKFALVRIDGDSTPELIATVQNDTYYESSCYVVLSYKKGKLVKKRFDGGVWGGASYIPGKGKLYQFSYNRGSGMIYEDIYRLSSKGFSSVHGEYRNDWEPSLIKWNSKQVSKTVYEKNIHKAFNTSEAQSFEKITFKSKTAILKKLK